MLLAAALTLVLQAEAAGPSPGAREAAGAMQPLVSQSVSRLVNDGDVLGAYLALRDLAPAAEDAPLREAMFLDQSTADLAAIAGRDGEAMASFSRMFQRLGREPAVLDFEFERVETAVPLILTRAGVARVVMLNEAHHLSVHRRFAEHLARRLFDQGYTVLSLEALRSDIGGPVTRPLLHSDGFYTNDPAMANLVRFFLERGGIVVGHEGAMDARVAGGDRSQLQAQAIADHLVAYSDQKILVLAGWGHVSEGGAQMAARLHQLTGVDPLTIDQTAPAPASQDCGSEPRIYFSAGEDVVTVGASARADLIIRHGPPCGDSERRRDWMLNYRSVVLEAPFAAPLLVQAHRPGEQDETVPLDQRIILEDEPVQLLLRRGVFDITFSAPGHTPGRERIEVGAAP